jgi:GNAT superfamily N-acetyltransferase
MERPRRAVRRAREGQGVLTIQEVTADRWHDLADLFGPSGAYSGCWCMWWRLTSTEFAANGNPGNRAALEAVVVNGGPVGLLAYKGEKPLGWASVSPRRDYRRIGRSPKLKPATPDETTWSIPCFFIHRGHRSEGIATALLKAAVTYARKNKAKALEGYPVDTHGEKRAQPDLFTGTVSLFAKEGFSEVRSAGKRVVMVKKL